MRSAPSLLASVLGVALAALAPACAPRPQAPRADAAAAPPRPASGPSPAEPGERVLALDPAGGTAPRAWRFVEAGPGGAEVLARLEEDLNGDGAVDTWWRWAPDGTLAELAWDSDFDGRVDGTIAFARGAPARKVEALGARGRVESAYERGALVRKDLDLDGDGRTDASEEWSHGRIQRLGSAAGDPSRQK
jgi:hypothetical protein